MHNNTRCTRMEHSASGMIRTQRHHYWTSIVYTTPQPNTPLSPALPRPPFRIALCKSGATLITDHERLMTAKRGMDRDETKWKLLIRSTRENPLPLQYCMYASAVFASSKSINPNPRFSLAANKAKKARTRLMIGSKCAAYEKKKHIGDLALVKGTQRAHRLSDPCLGAHMRCMQHA